MVQSIWPALALILTLCPLGWAQTLEDSLSDISALFPNEPGYVNASRAFNQRFEVSPAGITYPSSVEQVSKVVQVGATFGLPVVARSGGHSYIANGLGGRSGALVLDLRNLTSLSYNPSSQTALVGAGTRLGVLAPFLDAYGRGIPHGSCAYVGIGGHAAFGGFGFASRMWGLSVDNVVGAEMVLANGTAVNVSQTAHPDLFWATRGSAPSFGIVTSYTFKTYAVPSSGLIFNYDWMLSSNTAALALSAFQSRFASLVYPRMLSFELVMTPAQTKGSVNLNLVGGWYGDPALLNTTLAPFIEGMPPPRAQGLGGGTWLESVRNLAGGSLDTTAPPGSDTFYTKSLVTKQGHPLTDQAIRAFVDYLADQGVNSTTGWFLQLELWAGSDSAISRVDGDEMAFGQRDAFLSIQLYSSSGRPPPYPDEGIELVNGMVDAIVSNSPPGWPYGAYMNYVDDKLANWQHLYYGRHYPRLQRLKKKYDPTNVFRFPTSIELP